MALAILIIGTLFNAFVGLLVIAKNHNRAARTLFFVAIALIVWEVANYSADMKSTMTLFWNQLAFVGPMLVLLLSYYFVSFMRNRSVSNTTSLILVGGTLVVTVASFTPLIVNGVQERTAGGVTLGYNPIYGPAYVVYLLWLTVLIGFYATSLSYLKRIDYLQQKEQLQLIRNGSIAAVILALCTNLILPNILNSSYASRFAPLASIFFMGAMAVAILRHKLFDIRLVVARAIAYVVSIAILATVYGLIVFSVARFVFGLNIPVVAQVFLSAATGIAGLIFQRPIKLFDKVTNQVFYQDAYEPQELFDYLNRVLVSSLDLNYLLRHASQILADNLKAEYVVVGLKGNTEGQYRISGTTKIDFANADIEHLRKLTPKYHQSVIVSDYLEEKHREIKNLMNRNNIAVIVRLTPDVRKDNEGLGYIVLGAKKSGNPYSNQDIRVLDTVANELIIAIQNALHFEEIQQFNVTLQSRVNDATRQLRRTNQKLEALDETKDDFISMASHQLRTPLTSVKGYLSMVLEGDAGKINDTQKKMLNQAFISSQRMVYLIADLLNVSRLKTGKFIIDWAPVDLSKVIQEEISQLTETAKSRGITLTYKKPADFPVVQLDETKTRQVIMNFVDNAIYYTPAGGHIAVELEDHVVSIELKVVDDGIGVPKAEQHHLFTKFYRARNAQRARPDGTGLGLFMAKKVVLAQGGSIIFESKEGKGSTFGFTFPKVALERLSAAAPQPQLAPKTSKTAAKK
jgi:signal transduction histidine kinase